MKSKMCRGHYTYKQTSLLAVFLIVMTASASNGIAQDSGKKSATKVVLASEVQWQQLNPKRGDSSPQAATLWGDRNGTEATGFLVKFVDGFSSPPHIHNVSYRGVVIAGGVHNDDPEAKPMWMPAGSYWTQPAGEVHITASRGVGIAFIEIDKGPYLVLPVEEAADNGERPVNVDPSNIVWLDGTNTSWIGQPQTEIGKGPEIAFLWGNPKDDQISGTLVKLPAGFSGKIHSQAESFQAVVVAGQSTLQLADEAEIKSLSPGSYVTSQGAVSHQISCQTGDSCVIYVRSKGKFKVIPQS